MYIYIVHEQIQMGPQTHTHCCKHIYPLQRQADKSQDVKKSIYSSTNSIFIVFVYPCFQLPTDPLCPLLPPPPQTSYSVCLHMLYSSVLVQTGSLEYDWNTFKHKLIPHSYFCTTTIHHTSSPHSLSLYCKIPCVVNLHYPPDCVI